jgi:hypothetical protein
MSLLKSHHSKQKYITTEKGLRFLQKWIEIQQILAEGKDSSVIRHPVFDNQLLTPLEFET